MYILDDKKTLTNYIFVFDNNMLFFFTLYKGYKSGDIKVKTSDGGVYVIAGKIISIKNKTSNQ